MKKPVDTYAETVRSIARTILDSGVRGLRPGDAKRVEEKLAATGDDLDDSFNLTYWRADSRVQCELMVRLERDYSAGRQTDDEGNVWTSSTVLCSVSWPSHGSNVLAQAQARLSLYAEVLAIATEVQATFPNVVYQLRMTAAEVEASKGAAAERAAAEKAAQDAAAHVPIAARRDAEARKAAAAERTARREARGGGNPANWSPAAKANLEARLAAKREGKPCPQGPFIEGVEVEAGGDYQPTLVKAEVGK